MAIHSRAIPGLGIDFRQLVNYRAVFPALQRWLGVVFRVGKDCSGLLSLKLAIVAVAEFKLSILLE